MNAIVQKQILLDVETIKRLLDKVVLQSTCDHKASVLELQNTFKPVKKLRCTNCGAWLE
jgi:hypothetical protein